MMSNHLTMFILGQFQKETDTCLQRLPFCSKLHITNKRGNIQCDTMFPRQRFFVYGGVKKFDMTAFSFSEEINGQFNWCAVNELIATYLKSCSYLDPIKPSMAEFPFHKINSHWRREHVIVTLRLGARKDQIVSVSFIYLSRQ